MEVKTNLLAAYVSAGVPTKALAFIAQLQRAGEAEEMTYEASYNAACALIEAGDIPGAGRQLESAESKSSPASLASPVPSTVHILNNMDFNK
jgi:hypothetical protein